MLTLVAIYVLAIAVGAGCALIYDLFFMISLKHHLVKSHEAITLKQLNNIQVVLIIWILIAEVAMIAMNFQYAANWHLAGVVIAKVFIEIVILFCALLLRQVHLPQLLRNQHQHGHLSDSFLEHHDSLVSTCALSLVSWFFIVLITSGEFNRYMMDFGFIQTIMSYVIVSIFAIWLVVYLKNNVLHRKNLKK
jgi:hypothetical protein